MMLPVLAALWTYGFIGVFGLILASVGLAGLTAYSCHVPARKSLRIDPVVTLRQE